MSEPFQDHYFARVAIRDKEGRYLVVHNIGTDKVFSPGSPRNRWELPGGKLDAGEKGHQAAIREAFEEVGLVIDGVKFIMNVTYTSDAGKWIGQFYLAEPRCVSGKAILKEPHKFDDMRWVTPRELEFLPQIPALCIDVVRESEHE